MPNGADRNWVRVVAALEGFFVAHGHWPLRVRLPLVSLENLHFHLFTPASWHRLNQHIQFIQDESAGIIAEDDAGNIYNYGTQGFPKSRPATRAEEWLGVRPDTPAAHDPH